MKIAFDGRYAEGDLVGVGKFIKSLVVELSQKGVDCVIFYSKKPKFSIIGPNIKSVLLGNSNRYIFEQILLPLVLIKEKVDLYHATGNIGIPLFCPVPSILTVHDIIPLEIKDYFSYSPAPILSRVSYLSRLKLSLFRASKIVTDSDYVKKQISKRFGVNLSNIKTIYLGAPKLLDGGKLFKSLQPQKYILNHGGIDIRKNQERLIKAFTLFNKKHPEIKLVITGKNERIRSVLDSLLIRTDLINMVEFTGYVNEQDLSVHIKNALMICYPTLSEGFGFPVLEGFAAKVPVISSNISSIPEVAGDAALLVDPEKIEEIAQAMEKVYSDKDFRQKMVLKGTAQYNRFDWKTTANDYLALYNSLK